MRPVRQRIGSILPNLKCVASRLEITHSGVSPKEIPEIPILHIRRRGGVFSKIKIEGFLCRRDISRLLKMIDDLAVNPQRIISEDVGSSGASPAAVVEFESANWSYNRKSWMTGN